MLKKSQLFFSSYIWLELGTIKVKFRKVLIGMKLIEKAHKWAESVIFIKKSYIEVFHS